MIYKVNKENYSFFEQACKHERVFGSKILSSAHAYGLDRQDTTFWVDISSNKGTTAIFLRDSVAVISSNNDICPHELSEFIKQKNIHETDTNWEQCEGLLNMLGGTTESSFYMEYNGEKIEGDFSLLMDNYNLRDVFSVLQQSHEYYRTHYKFDVWSEDLELKLNKGICSLFQLNVDGKPIGTGMIVSEDDKVGAIAAVAVIPEYRGKKWGTYISSGIVNKILEKGKKPVLISGYDAVAELYKQIGFTQTGRWGELYL